MDVIESCLVAELGQILSPLTMSVMSEDKVTQIAGENNESRKAREELERKMKVLQSGADICRKFCGYRVTGEWCRYAASFH